MRRAVAYVVIFAAVNGWFFFCGMMASVSPIFAVGVCAVLDGLFFGAILLVWAVRTLSE